MFSGWKRSATGAALRAHDAELRVTRGWCCSARSSETFDQTANYWALKTLDDLMAALHILNRIALNFSQIAVGVADES
jgi:hypothetical protein